MQTKTGFASPPNAPWINEGALPMTCYEVQYRMQRLLDEAASEQLVAGRAGVRQHLGHALMTLGRAIHGVEPGQQSQSALQTR